MGYLVSDLKKFYYLLKVVIGWLLRKQIEICVKGAIRECS